MSQHTDRLSQLFDFLEKEPNDPFLLYAIATEYVNTDTQKAVTYFEQLLTDHPDYTATYYHAAKLYTMLQNYTRANQLYQEGMQKCETLKQAHALRELKSAYEVFLLEFEDEL